MTQKELIHLYLTDYSSSGGDVKYSITINKYINRSLISKALFITPIVTDTHIEIPSLLDETFRNNYRVYRTSPTSSIAFPIYIPDVSPITFTTIGKALSYFDTISSRLGWVEVRGSIYYGNNSFIMDENFRILVMKTHIFSSVNSDPIVRLIGKSLYVNPICFLPSKSLGPLESLIHKGIVELATNSRLITGIIIKDVSKEFLAYPKNSDITLDFSDKINNSLIANFEKFITSLNPLQYEPASLD